MSQVSQEYIVKAPKVFNQDTWTEIAWTMRHDVKHVFFSTAEALGSSAIVKVSEQTGAAPKPIPPRFPSKGSQVKVPKVPKVPSRFPRLPQGSQGSSRFPKGSQKVPKRFPQVPQGSFKVPSRFPARFPSFPSKGCQGSQDYYVKVPK